MTKIVFEGKVQIEVDEVRGVVYVHSLKHGYTILRICRLTKGAIQGLDLETPQLDVIAVNPKDDLPIEVLAQFQKELKKK